LAILKSKENILGL